MRFTLIQLALFLLACCMCEAGIVQRRQRNAGELLVPVTIIEDDQGEADTKRKEVQGIAAGIGDGVGEELPKTPVPHAPEDLANVQGIPTLDDDTRDSTVDAVLAQGSGGNPEIDGSLRQVTQATPTQTTQQNFVQQLIQNSPLGQFFNQISGQNTQALAANDEAPATPLPTIPGFLAPAVTTFQNAAQTVVNSTTTAIQGLQQFASNLGNQFQSTLSGLGGQPQQSQQNPDATTARPAGPFQQLVNTFMGNNANPQDTPAPPQGPLQGLLNIFQNNNNRPQQANENHENAQPVAAKPVSTQSEEPNEQLSSNGTNEVSNDIRSSHESEDSFEDPGQHGEMIVVQDDVSEPEGSDPAPENDQATE